MLTQGVLRYFKSPGDAVPKGSIAIRDCLMVCGAPPNEVKGKLLCFKVVTPKRDYVFQVPTSPQRTRLALLLLFVCACVCICIWMWAWECSLGCKDNWIACVCQGDVAFILYFCMEVM